MESFVQHSIPLTTQIDSETPHIGKRKAVEEPTPSKRRRTRAEGIEKLADAISEMSKARRTDTENSQ